MPGLLPVAGSVHNFGVRRIASDEQEVQILWSMLNSSDSEGVEDEDNEDEPPPQDAAATPVAAFPVASSKQPAPSPPSPAAADSRTADKPLSAYLGHNKPQQEDPRNPVKQAERDKSHQQLMDRGEHFASMGYWREAGISFGQAIHLRTDDPVAFFNLGAAFSALGQESQAAQCYLVAQKHAPEGSGCWAHATATAFDLLRLKECSALAKPRWWNDEELKIMSARVVVAAPHFEGAHRMVAMVLSGLCDGVWEVGPRSVADLKDAAAHFEMSVPLCGAHSAELARCADWCRRQAEAVHSHAACG